ncbi:hypothetical protein D3C86_1782790 [compost metagenome]
MVKAFCIQKHQFVVLAERFICSSFTHDLLQGGKDQCKWCPELMRNIGKEIHLHLVDVVDLFPLHSLQF